MAENRERKHFRASEIRPYAIQFREASMSDPKETLSLKEAERRSRKAADKLADLLNQVDAPPNEIDDKTCVKLNSLFMSLLAKRYSITPPDTARIDIESE